MSNEQNGSGAVPLQQEPDFAQAFKDLARGEQAAAAMEKNLDTLEKRIEKLLAKAAEDEKKMNAAKKPKQDGDSIPSGDPQ